MSRKRKAETLTNEDTKNDDNDEVDDPKRKAVSMKSQLYDTAVTVNQVNEWTVENVHHAISETANEYLPKELIRMCSDFLQGTSLVTVTLDPNVDSTVERRPHMTAMRTVRFEPHLKLEIGRTFLRWLDLSSKWSCICTNNNTPGSPGYEQMTDPMLDAGYRPFAELMESLLNQVLQNHPVIVLDYYGLSLSDVSISYAYDPFSFFGQCGEFLPEGIHQLTGVSSSSELWNYRTGRWIQSSALILRELRIDLRRPRHMRTAQQPKLVLGPLSWEYHICELGPVESLVLYCQLCKPRHTVFASYLCTRDKRHTIADWNDCDRRQKSEYVCSNCMNQLIRNGSRDIHDFHFL